MMKIIDRVKAYPLLPILSAPQTASMTGWAASLALLLLIFHFYH